MHDFHPWKAGWRESRGGKPSRSEPYFFQFATPLRTGGVKNARDFGLCDFLPLFSIVSHLEVFVKAYLQRLISYFLQRLVGAPLKRVISPSNYAFRLGYYYVYREFDIVYSRTG
jgi:hypothetical protein